MSYKYWMCYLKSFHQTLLIFRITISNQFIIDKVCIQLSINHLSSVLNGITLGLEVITGKRVIT